MILILKDADFSANNIGKVELPREVSKFTLSALAASGNKSLTGKKVLALDTFFGNIGAISNSGIWPKLKLFTLPLIAGSLDKALVNYKDNSVIYSVDGAYWELVDGVLSRKASGEEDKVLLLQNNVLDMANSSFGVYDTYGMYDNTSHYGLQANGTNANAISLNGTGGNQINYIFYHNPAQSKRTVVIDPTKDFSGGHVRMAVINSQEAFAVKIDNNIIRASRLEGADSYQDGDTRLKLGYGLETYVGCKFSAMFYGSALTEDEAVLLKTEIEKLVDAFTA